jgi:serine/threonine protein kinase
MKSHASRRLARPAPAAARFGKFVLVDRLGRGGMAEVWKARMSGPAGFQRVVVVKRILPHLAEDPSFVEMFLSEARLSARLNHTNIVHVYELGEAEGEYYLAMEYVRGKDLVSVMRAEAQRQYFDPGLAAFAVREVCRALHYAHVLTDEDGAPLRLIHRDVSPSNVMLAFDGAVKLLDFGIAKALSDANDNRTQTGTLKGKFGYMAPEQVTGRDFDHRADLFAAGVVLHEALTGRRLFKGATDLQTISLVREARVQPPSAVNMVVGPELDRICLKALAREPEDRYQTCDEMARDLDEVVRELAFTPERLCAQLETLFPDEPSRTSLPGAPELSVPSLTPKRRRGTTWFLLLLLFASGGFLVWSRYRAVLWAASPLLAAREAPAPRPEPPALVHVRVQSTPPGAEVSFEGVSGVVEASGTTPVTLEVPRGEGARRLVVQLQGYRPAEETVVPSSEVTVKLALEPLPPPPASPPAAPPVVRRPPPRRPVHAAKPTSDLRKGELADPFR